jgi:hypothetical protein
MKYLIFFKIRPPNTGRTLRRELIYPYMGDGFSDTPTKRGVGS